MNKKIIKSFSLLALTAVIISCSNESVNTINFPVESQNVVINKVRTEINLETKSFVAVNDSELQPDGKSTFNWTIKLTDKAGNILKGTKVNFSVKAVSPTTGWRTVNELAPKYGSSAEKFKQLVANGNIRLLGTVNPVTAVSDANGIVKTTYRVSSIGSNEAEMAKETILATSSDSVLENNVDIGYRDLVPLPLIDGAIRIGDVTGKYIQKDIYQLLFNLGMKIKEQNWAQPLTITAGTLRWGGLYPPHFEHRRGGSMDFRPMSTDGQATFCNTDGTFAPNYDRAKTLELLKVLIKSGAVDVYFNDPEAKKLGVKPLAGHHNHFHASWLIDGDSRITKNINVNAPEIIN